MSTFPSALDPLLSSVLETHRAWEAGWPAVERDPSLRIDPAVLAGPLRELGERLRENYPHFHPLYAGQMLKPPHPAAVLGYLAAMLVNPNNHALDGGRATATMEKEAVALLARMFGYGDDRFMGHLTASGTIANLEALWVARELHPDRPIVFTSDAHYTHKRMCALLRAQAVELPVTPRGHLDLAALDALAAQGPIGTVVVTLGTTGLGAIDPLPAVLERARKHGFRVHADMAYGGYYRLLAAREAGLSAFASTGDVDSLVVDPHKHGLQPYGCGCVLFRDASIAQLYAHASPYTYFSSPEHHPGETTLECSRAGAAAAALWLTQKVLPLDGDAGMAAVMAKCLDAGRAFAAKVRASREFALLVEPELDIVSYFPKRASLSAISTASDAVFARAEGAAEPVYLAKLSLDGARFHALHPEVAVDAKSVTLLRSVLMRPEQAAWGGTLMERLEGFAKGA
ncbi:MAG TPA: aminotransferase class V-fold PLP-dependent enzyme [Polyangiaceae bacterium]|jgi:glutamate/tyrosine decarboxylase-like PLP-dependent enzyme